MLAKVLVVDDESAARDLFSDLLVKEGCLVSSVASGEEALAVLAKEKFDVVLLDIKLPGMNGLEALKKVKVLNKDIVVIMITGFGYDDALITKSKDLGCSGYIGKNLPIPQIISSFKLFLKNAKEKGKPEQ